MTSPGFKKSIAFPTTALQRAAG